jgi:flagellar biosynthesis protein
VAKTNQNNEDAWRDRVAVALRYRFKEDKVPRVTATGKGLIAEQILKLAQKNKVPIREDEDLVQLLGKLELNEAIPPELYQIVAEVLVYVYKANQEMGDKN